MNPLMSPGSLVTLAGTVLTVVGTIATATKSLSLTMSARTVGTASAQLLAANPSRAYLMIQNNDTSGTIAIVTGAGPAALVGCVRIGPGGFWEWDGAGAVPPQALQAIGTVAGMPVTVVEG